MLHRSHFDLADTLSPLQKVEAGTFMPIGGSWVENDTNLPSGESLCRQMIFGQRYFKSRFGKYCDVHWLPDTFGYSSQLPQICRLAGMPSFFTQKLSWSQFNTFPHTYDMPTMYSFLLSVQLTKDLTH